MTEETSKKITDMVNTFTKKIPKLIDMDNSKGVIVYNIDHREYTHVMVTVKMLLNLNPSINVQWYYNGRSLNADEIDTIYSLGIMAVDISLMSTMTKKSQIDIDNVTARFIRTHIMLSSSLTHMILLRPDVFPITDITDLFNDDTYKKYGNMLWREMTNDRTIISEDHSKKRDILFNHLKMEEDKELSRLMISDSIVVINKRRCWNALYMDIFTQYYMMKTGEDIFMNDKTFYIPLTVSNIEYNLVNSPHAALGILNNGMVDTIIYTSPNKKKLVMHKYIPYISNQVTTTSKYMYEDIDLQTVKCSKGFVRVGICKKRSISNEISDTYRDIRRFFMSVMASKITKSTMINKIKEHSEEIITMTNNIDRLFVVSDMAKLTELNSIITKTGYGTVDMHNISVLFMIESGKYLEAFNTIRNICTDDIQNTRTVDLLVYLCNIARKKRLKNIKLLNIPTQYILYVLTVLYNHGKLFLEVVYMVLIKTNNPFYVALGEILRDYQFKPDMITQIDNLLNMKDHPVFPRAVRIKMFDRISIPSKNTLIRISSMHRKLCTSINYISKNTLIDTKTPDDKINIGFISSHYTNDSASKYMIGIIKDLDRDIFNVDVFHFKTYRSNVYFNILWQTDSDHIVLPEDHNARMSVIEKRDLDILVYCDVTGNDGTFLLAHSRLARLQITTMLNLGTTGISTIDKYITSRYYGSNSTYLYSESIVKMSSLGLYCFKETFDIYDKADSKVNAIMKKDKKYITILQRMSYIYCEDILRIKNILNNTDEDVTIVLIDYDGDPNSKKEFFKRMVDCDLDNEEDTELYKRIHIFSRPNSRDIKRIIGGSYLILDTSPFYKKSCLLNIIGLNKLTITISNVYNKTTPASGLYSYMDVTAGITNNSNEFVNRVIYYTLNEDALRTVETMIKHNKKALYCDKSSVMEWNYTLVKLHQGINKKKSISV